ncbi:MAG: TrkH family potassium uptake protein [Phycisphaerae bacterium]
MIPVLLWCVIEGTPQQIAAAKSLGLTCLLAAAFILAVWCFLSSNNRRFGRREAFLMVTLTWILAPAVAGLPFLLWAHVFSPSGSHPFLSPINCYFEAMSGLTTTGASILVDIEALPRGLLLWRSETHWLGGLGIVLLFVAVLPLMGVTSRKLHSVESTGPLRGDTGPGIRDTARILWISYLVITVISALALRTAGLPWFNAVCEAFGAIATGGFSVRNASIASYKSPVVDTIIVIVMIFGAVNFSLYHELARGKWRRVWRDPELRALLVLLVVGSVVVVLSILPTDLHTIAGDAPKRGWLASIRHGVFNYVSMHTDTGFATVNFDSWPSPAILAIVLGTFIGGSAGSTTGGIKVVRFYAAAKILLKQVDTMIRPSVVKPVRMGGRTLSIEEQSSLLQTIIWFVVALVLGTIVLMLIGSSTGNVDLRTAFSASLVNLCTAGPGLGGVGPTQNYLWLPDASKLVLCALMLVGRLEIVPVLALFHPKFWSST